MLFEIRNIPRGTSAADKSILARSSLDGLLARYFGIVKMPSIEKDRNGKPFFPEHPEVHFSLSHCGVAVMAAVDTMPIGCDVEDVQKDCPQALLDVALSKEEARRVLLSDNPPLAFTEIWTRKEAVAKRSGVIPDDPRSWTSEDPNLITRACPSEGYVFSIATSPRD